ncbi:MAG UNVERIFIED_CONTAM: hypothetical protein LVR18_12420 [Planctomycetaceae bacterium]|jgi:hypothetical protein
MAGLAGIHRRLAVPRGRFNSQQWMPAFLAVLVSYSFGLPVSRADLLDDIRAAECFGGEPTKKVAVRLSIAAPEQMNLRDSRRNWRG